MADWDGYQVARLRKELEHCNMRLSQMQTRLLATLDELDASRAAHQQELKTEKRAKEKLSEKLDRYLDEVKRAEAERDEMREVVSILVEKGVYLVQSQLNVHLQSAEEKIIERKCGDCPVWRHHWFHGRET